MPLFSFKALKKAYRQVQFEDKLGSIVAEATDDAFREIFLFAGDVKIKELLSKLLKDVEKLINRYKMHEKRDEIIRTTSRQFQEYVNQYIVNNIKYLPTRDRTQPLPF